jgi:hypothetical protein
MHHTALIRAFIALGGVLQIVGVLAAFTPQVFGQWVARHLWRRHPHLTVDAGAATLYAEASGRGRRIPGPADTVEGNLARLELMIDDLWNEIGAGDAETLERAHRATTRAVAASEERLRAEIAVRIGELENATNYEHTRMAFAAIAFGAGAIISAYGAWLAT